MQKNTNMGGSIAPYESPETRVVEIIVSKTLMASYGSDNAPGGVLTEDEPFIL